MKIRALATLGLALAVLSASVGTSVANVALPDLVSAFTATPAQVQWVVVGYLLAMTGVSITVGALGDRWGRRRILLVGIAVFTLGAVVGALAPTLPVLITARVAQGVGAAAMTALPLALARDVTADGQTGRIMGVLGTTSAIGTALGPALGGTLIGWGGWAAAFWMMVPLGAASLLLATALPSSDTTPRPRGRFDISGSVLLTAGVATYAFALTSPGSNWPTAPLLLGAVALLGGFAAVERRAAHPVLPLATLRHRSITTGMITNVLVATVMMSTLVVGPYALHNGLELSLPLVGLVMSVGPVTSAVSGILAGRLVDRTTPAVMITAGLALVTLGAACLALLPSWWGSSATSSRSSSSRPATSSSSPRTTLTSSATPTRPTAAGSPARWGSPATSDSSPAPPRWVSSTLPSTRGWMPHRPGHSARCARRFSSPRCWPRSPPPSRWFLSRTEER